MKKLIILILCCLAVAARAENVVSVSSVSGHPQDEVTLQVSLANTDAAVAFQTEIPLGSQLTYVANSIALNPDRVTDHQVTAAVVNGTLKIFAYSLSLSPFVGDSGNLLTFTLKLKNEPGDYSLNMSDSKLSNASGTALPINTLNGTVTILSPKLSINTASLNYGHVPIRSEYTQTAQVSNVGNEPLTITNITFSDAVFSCPSFTETILQPGASASFTFKFAPMLKGTITAAATIVSNSISGNGAISLVADPYAVNEIHVGNVTGYCDSIVELPISMNNMEDIIGFQIEANLNDAMEFIDFTLSDRKADHVATGIVSGATLRLMAYSPSGSAFTGEDGVLGAVRFRLHGLYGNYYLNPAKAVLADAQGEDALSAKYQGYVNIRSPKITGNSSLSFGSTPVTETVTKEYVVSNNGNASMRIDQVVFDQADFAVAETFPITVGQYSNTTLHVSYSREQKGDFNAIMKIYSNDPQNGLKNVALSGHRYEPNSVSIAAEPMGSVDDSVIASIGLDNYSGIVALQTDFVYPCHDYSISSSDFQLTDRFQGHNLYAIQANDSTYRILVLSMQNATVDAHEGAVLNITMHPVGTPSWEAEYMVSLSNVVLSGVEGENQFTGEDVGTTFTFGVTQSTQLAAGWNWWSTFIEMDGVDGLTLLENGLDENGMIIKSPNGNYLEYYSEWEMWWGNDFAIENTSMYEIKTNAACALPIAGIRATPSSHPITIRPGWNWIGYTANTGLTTEMALSSLTPSEDDIIQSRLGFSQYWPGFGFWGSIETMSPGNGYKYRSNDTENQTLVYPSGNRGMLSEMEEQLVSASLQHQYFMDVVAVVELDEESVRNDLFEVRALSKGQIRGCTSLRYCELIDRYVAMLVVYGDGEEDIAFSLVDKANGSTYYGPDVMAFKSDEVVGSLKEPKHLRFGHNWENTSRYVIDRVFPNPVVAGGNFNLAVADGLDDDVIEKLEIVNVYGQSVFTASSVAASASMTAPETAGVYVLRILADGKTYYGTLIVTK